MYRITLAVLSLVAALALAGCGGDDGGSVPTDAVAVVDGQNIERSAYDQLITQAKSSYKLNKRDFPAAGTADYQQLKSQAVQFLVQRAEYDQKADDLGIKVTDKQVDDRLEQIKKQYFGGKDKEYKKRLKQQGLTEEQVRADVRAQIISEGLYNKVTSNVKVTDKEIAAYYKQNKSQFGTPETRDVRHILVKSKALADKLYTELEAGGDFAALAKKYSQDPGSKNQGGKLTITRGQTVAPFDQTAFLLKTNAISRPVKTEYGYHIIQPTSATKPATTKPLDKKLETQIRQQLASTKKSKAMTTWAEKTKKEYEDKVEYASGFAPPATSTTTTK
jgi:parvulin-like peptidyl-prolyl isomerase